MGGKFCLHTPALPQYRIESSMAWNLTLSVESLPENSTMTAVDLLFSQRNLILQLYKSINARKETYGPSNGSLGSQVSKSTSFQATMLLRGL